MDEVKNYCELQAIGKFYQFELMKTNNYNTKKEQKENERLFTLATEYKNKLEVIQKEKKNDSKFWEDVSIYCYKNADALINAKKTFSL